MCKLVAITNMPEGISHSRLNAIIVRAGQLLADSQPDGLGLSIVTNSGNRYTERHVDPDTFNGVGCALYTVRSLPKGLRTTLREGVSFDVKGKVPDLTTMRSLIMHGRTATCGKNITNTHPFSKYDERLGGDWTIAHNGVVDWDGKSTLPLDTTCDSEHLLNCYAYLDGEKSFVDNISGYAAIVGFTPSGEMFAFRDDKAPLHFIYHPKANTSVIATDPAHAEELMKLICKSGKLKFTDCTETVKLADWTSHIWRIDGSNAIESTSVVPFDKGYGRINSSYVQKSLGSATGRYDDWYDRYPSGYNYGSSYKSTPAAPVSTTPPAADTKKEPIASEQYEMWRLSDIDTAVENVRANKQSYDDDTYELVEKIAKRSKLLAARMRKEGRNTNDFLTESELRLVFGSNAKGADLIGKASNESRLDFLSDSDWQDAIEGPDDGEPTK